MTICGSCTRRNSFSGRVLRIGFDNAPPYTIFAPDGSPRGFAVELIQEAARRQQIRLQWIKVDKPGFDLDDMLNRKVLDLWPVVGIARERLAKIYIARPFLENNFFLVSRAAAPVISPEQAAGRRVIHIKGPLAAEMSGKFLGRSRLLPVRGFANLLGPVCRGAADAAFMEARTLEAVLLDRPADCNGVSLKVSSVQNAIGHAGIGARREHSGAAEALTDEIIAMAADGTFSRAVDRWSSFSATETRSLVALQQAHERDIVFHRGLWALLVTCLALGGLAGFAFRARRNAERAHANEASRADILRQLAQGSPLDEIVALLTRSLEQSCRRLRCSIILAATENALGDSSAAITPIVDSRGSQIGMLTIHDRAAKLTREERKAIDAIRQLAAIVAEHRRLQSELQRQASQDRLTGLANRSVFAATIAGLTENSAGLKGTAGLFYFDLDRFKQVNDRFGHGVGDIYLQQAAERIGGCFGPCDLVARLGGDEFAAVSHELDPADADRICQSVIDAFGIPFLIDGFRIFGGVSVGMSSFPQDGTTPVELQRSADAALYDAKKRGRNRFTICSPSIRECAGSTIVAEQLIRKALENNWIELFYQPQVAVDGELVGMEALVRIRHPEQGIISATEFIEIAEHAGLVTEIDAWVVPEAMRQYAEWRRMGLKPVRIAVNISRLDLSYADVFNRVISALNEFGLSPDAIQIELTETAAVLGGETSIVMLRQLKKAGISLALDDFGCGYSSLSSLHGLPVDTVKIDKSFVQRLNEETGSTSLISAMIAAARALRMSVIAEGIENEQQMWTLSTMGCDVLQGYHIAHPLNAAAAGQFLADRLKVDNPSALEFSTA